MPFYQVQPANFRTENREPAAEDIIVGASGHLPIDGGTGIHNCKRFTLVSILSLHLCVHSIFLFLLQVQWMWVPTSSFMTLRYKPVSNIIKITRNCSRINRSLVTIKHFVYFSLGLIFPFQFILKIIIRSLMLGKWNLEVISRYVFRNGLWCDVIMISNIITHHSLLKASVRTFDIFASAHDVAINF